MIQVDRSRVLSYQSCPRKRFLEYHFHGTGIQRVAKSLPLIFGSAFHAGTELLLTGNVEGAVLRSQLFLSNAFEEKGIGFDGETPANVEESMKYGMEEQGALAEALLRGFWAFEGEQFLKDFEVLEVEQEGRAALTPPTKYEFTQPYGPKYGSVVESDQMIWMFRPDALVRERLSGDLYVVSWKTCSMFTQRTINQCKVDMQSISEVWGVQNTLTIAGVLPLQVEGVLYKFACKGTRRKDEYDGLYKQDSHLIYGWKKLSGGEEDWSWAYKWTDPDEINPKTGKPVGHTLGKGWMKVPIWRDYPGGVKAWIEALAAGEIAPRHESALAKVFPQALPISRRGDEIERWKRQTIAQETRIGELVAIRAPWQEGLEPREEWLDENFPQYTHSCHAYSGCPYFDCCWTPAVTADPVGSGLYKIRTETNHPEKGDEE